MELEEVFDKIKSGEFTLEHFKDFINDKHEDSYFMGYSEGQNYV